MTVTGSLVLALLSNQLHSPDLPYVVYMYVPDALFMDPLQDPLRLYDGYEYIRDCFLQVPFDTISRWHDPLTARATLRGKMNRQGTITPLGVADYEANGEIKGSLALKVHLADDKVKIDLRIVNEGGQTLAEWEGVDVIDDSQITWCFSDVGDIKLVMNPIIEPSA